MALDDKIQLYRGLDFSSVARIIKHMNGLEFSGWRDVYLNSRFDITRNALHHSTPQSGYSHNLLKEGWKTADLIQLDMRPVPRGESSYTERTFSLFRVYREPTTDEIIELHLAYELPDINDNGLQEVMRLYLRGSRHSDPPAHRLTERAILAYDGLDKVASMITTQLHVQAARSGSPLWEQPRYVGAFEEISRTLRIEELK